MWPVSDEAMVAALATGDSEAATAFVRRFQARVFGLAVTMVGDHAVAEEIAQETFLRAWRHASAYDPRRSAVATWLLAIARNLAVDHLRMKHADSVDPGALGDQATAIWAASGGSGEQDDELVDLREAIRSLPAEQRRALLLAALYGYTAREIGAIEGAPVGTAKTRIRTALIKVRGTLEEAGS